MILTPAVLSGRGLLPPFRFSFASLLERNRSDYGRRTTGIVLALVVEGLLVLLVLSLGTSITLRESEEFQTTVVPLRAKEQRQASAKSNEADEPTEKSQQAEPSRSTDTPEAAAAASQAKPPQADPAPALIRLSPSEMAAVDIASLPRRPPSPDGASRPKMGPPDTGTASQDTQRVGGSGPNGEPLYAASWYREPYDDELEGYLSTATGPGWGLIACRTAPDFRVEDCVKIDEYPTGSNIARSVLAAAWQFRVRPPRIGGQSRIGEWVRIRIDYDLRRESRAGRYHD